MSELANRAPEHLRRALLPWEDSEAFEALDAAWRRVYPPEGPAEAVLVDQLVMIDWRRRRLLLGERALHMAELERRADEKNGETLLRRAMIHSGMTDVRAADLSAPRTVLRQAALEDVAALSDADRDEAMTRAALSLLEAGGRGAYAKALEALREDTRTWWEETIEGSEDFVADASSLRRFLEEDALPATEANQKDAALRPALRLQAEGESLDPFRMDKILTLDERLVRQFEKALSMLIKLRGMRGV